MLPVAHALRPFSTYSLPSRRASNLSSVGSDPGTSGSVMLIAARISPFSSRGR